MAVFTILHIYSLLSQCLVYLEAFSHIAQIMNPQEIHF